MQPIHHYVRGRLAFPPHRSPFGRMLRKYAPLLRSEEGYVAVLLGALELLCTVIIIAADRLL